MQSELGGLFYEMAIRDHMRIEVLVHKAAELQRVDAELGQLERMIEAGSASVGGKCPSCEAVYAHGAAFCAQCATPSRRHDLPAALGPADVVTARADRGGVGACDGRLDQRRGAPDGVPTAALAALRRGVVLHRAPPGGRGATRRSPPPPPRPRGLTRALPPALAPADQRADDDRCGDDEPSGADSGSDGGSDGGTDAPPPPARPRPPPPRQARPSPVKHVFVIALTTPSYEPPSAMARSRNISTTSFASTERC